MSDVAPPQSRPEPATPRSDWRGVVAIVLVLLGLVLWLAYRLTAGSGHHVFDAGATPPSQVTLTGGKSYSLAVPDGTDRDDFPDDLSCSLTPAGGEPTTVDVTAESTGSRALNQIGRFVAPSSGSFTVACSELPRVFVDDADNASTDYSGLFLLLACISLAVGLPLLLSSLRGAGRPIEQSADPSPSETTT